MTWCALLAKPLSGVCSAMRPDFGTTPRTKKSLIHSFIHAESLPQIQERRIAWPGSQTWWSALGIAWSFVADVRRVWTPHEPFGAIPRAFN